MSRFKWNKLIIQKLCFFILLSVLTLSAYTQTSTIGGKIIDKNEEPIIGATVVVVGTTLGTISDINGDYSLEIPVDSIQVSVSSMGYVTQILDIYSREGEVLQYNLPITIK